MVSLEYHCFLWLVVKISISSANLEVNGSLKTQYAAVEGKILKDSSIKSVNVSSPADCILECLSTGLKCLSMNYINAAEASVCELNENTKSLAMDKYVSRPGSFHYYNYFYEKIRSCLDILKLGVRKSGIYKLIIEGVGLCEVYCDMDSEPKSAWTLILSFAFKNRLWRKFCNIGLSADIDDHKCTRPNWETYRMDRKQMTEISKHSSYVRITTGFLQYGIDYRDYIRAKISNFDILNFNGHAVCFLVDHINIRGHNASNVQAAIWQGTDFMFHIDSSRLPGQCAFDAKDGSVDNNDDFGHYCGGHFNRNFRGCENDESTTNFWFGGYL